MREIPLCDMEMGQKGRVTKLETEKELRKRLMELGLLEKTTVECVRKSPAGDPKAYLIRGAVIALRNKDAKTVFVEANL